MDTDDLYAIPRLLTISFPFSLSMLSWTFARLRENKETDPCHLTRQRTGKAENRTKYQVRQNSHLSSRSCHLGTAFQAPQMRDFRSIIHICFSLHWLSVVKGTGGSF